MQNLYKKSPKSIYVNVVHIITVEYILNIISLSSGRNLIGNLRIVRDIVADIHFNIQQWNSIHLNGVILLKNIIRLKIDIFYYEELKQPCKELEKMCDEADKIVDNLRLLTNHVKAVSKLLNKEDYLFQTWPIQKFISTTENIYQIFKKEALVKRVVLENVAHDHRHFRKIVYFATWLHQTQIPKNIAMNFESMLIETKLR